MYPCFEFVINVYESMFCMEQIQSLQQFLTPGLELLEEKHYMYNFLPMLDNYR